MPIIDSTRMALQDPEPEQPNQHAEPEQPSQPAEPPPPPDIDWPDIDIVEEGEEFPPERRGNGGNED